MYQYSYGSQGIFGQGTPFVLSQRGTQGRARDTRAKARDTSEAVHTLFNTSLPAGLSDFFRDGGLPPPVLQQPLNGKVAPITCIWAQNDGIISALMHRIDSDRLNMRFDDAWSQVSIVVPLVRAGSGAAPEVADYSGMIARASVLATSTRHI